MRLYGFVSLFGFGPFAPILQRDPDGRAVSVARETQKAESCDSGTALHSRGGERQVLNLLANGNRPIERRGERQLNVDIQIALILFRQEPRRKFFAEQT